MDEDAPPPIPPLPDHLIFDDDLPDELPLESTFYRDNDNVGHDINDVADHNIQQGQHIHFQQDVAHTHRDEYHDHMATSRQISRSPSPTLIFSDKKMITPPPAVIGAVPISPQFSLPIMPIYADARPSRNDEVVSPEHILPEILSNGKYIDLCDLQSRCGRKGVI